MIRRATLNDSARIAEIDVNSSRYAYKSIVSKKCLFEDLFTEKRIPVYENWISPNRFELYVYEDPDTGVLKNMENQYQYYILAIDENGKTYHLSAYSGPSGPSIGGNVTDMKLIEAAKVLAGYIRDADTEDYDYSGYYMDANLKINCGIKDGKVYCTTKKLSFFESILVHIFKGI